MTVSRGLEGVVGKHQASVYEAGKRCSSWLKVKATQSGEFIVGGAQPPPGNLAQHWDADSTRIREELGYREIVPLDEAIRRTLAWERANRQPL